MELAMTTKAQAVVTAFKALSVNEQNEVAVEVLRLLDMSELGDTTFEELAAELFRGYEAEESARAKP
jgi:hypothetical protein